MEGYFVYGERELDYLRSRDAALGEVIDRVGMLQVPAVGDLFTALANSITGQQISIKAQESIWRRLIEGFGHVNGSPNEPSLEAGRPQGSPLQDSALRNEWKGLGVLDAKAVVETPVTALRACGLSERKVMYIQRAARRFLDGEFRREELEDLDDESVIQRLISLDGVGRWTAEMLMITALQRPNILSYGDLGIQRGLAALHHHRLPISPRIFERYRRHYAPFATVASFYIWEAGRP